MAPKDDMGASVAEMVYGAPLTVPGAFVTPSSGPEASAHLQRMRDIAGRLVPAPDAWHGSKPVTPIPRLEEATFVFVRRDASHGPLQTPYTGPYRVLERREKFYTIQCGEREETVSVDRLKPAFADPDKPLQAAVPPKGGRPPKPKPADGDDPMAALPAREPSQDPKSGGVEQAPAPAGPQPEPSQAPPTRSRRGEGLCDRRRGTWP